jgi:trans-aconitate methyltransferase
MEHERPYVHGYHDREGERLEAQARSVHDLIHAGLRFPVGARVLEVGCGTGAQTISLATNSPGARIVSFDASATSLAKAERRLAAAGITNVELLRADVFDAPFEPRSFDHVFVCFVLEHLARPADLLVRLEHLLAPSGGITVFEGDHGSTYFHPHSDAALAAVACQVELQRRAGGNALVGRQLYPLLVNAGFSRVHVRPHVVYVDASRPELVEDFTRRTFTAMIESVRDQALDAGLIGEAAFDAGIRALYRTTEPDGVFCYTFFRATASPNPV